MYYDNLSVVNHLKFYLSSHSINIVVYWICPATGSYKLNLYGDYYVISRQLKEELSDHNVNARGYFNFIVVFAIVSFFIMLCKYSHIQA